MISTKDTTSAKAKEPVGVKFRDAVEESDRRLKGFIENRLYFLSQFSGPYYNRRGGAGEHATKGQIPLNTVFSMVSVYLPHLAYTNPKSYVTTPNAELRFQAESLGLELDRLMAEINFAQTMRTVVTDSLFSCGIIKTGLCPGREIDEFKELDGYLHDVGQAFADPVDLEDYVVDPNGRHREQASFEGNRYRLPLEYVMDSGLYHNTEGIQASEEDRKDRVSDLSGGDSKARLNDLRQYVDLVDLWLPHENMIITMPDERCGPPKMLMEIEYEGPERGPYEMLGYYWLPSNAMPIAPISAWFDLHILLNIMARKAGRQAERQKVVGLYAPTAAEDAETIRAASDGDLVATKDPNTIRELTLGGQNDRVMEYIGWLSSKVSENAGNMDLLGGTRAKSPTASQDAMLMNGATLRLDDMRNQVQQFTKHVLNKLAFYQWNDPLVDHQLTQRKGGVEIDMSFRAGELEGEFPDDFDIDIEPYSASHRSPEAQFEKKMRVLHEIILPLAQIGVASGEQIDAVKVVATLAKDLGIPDWDELIVPAMPMGPEAMPDGAMGGINGQQGGGASGGAPSPEQFAPEGATKGPAA